MRKSIIIFVLAIFPLALWADLISFTAPATLRKSDNTETTVLLKYETDTWYEPAGEVYLLGTIIGYYTFYRNFDIKVVASIIVPIYV